MLSVLAWNIDCQESHKGYSVERLRRCVDAIDAEVKAHDCCIVVLNEVPKTPDVLTSLFLEKDDPLVLVSPEHSHHTAILCSGGLVGQLEFHGYLDQKKRLAHASYSPRDIHVIGVHLFDKVNYQPGTMQRHESFSTVGKTIHASLFKRSGIIIGDVNEEPFEPFCAGTLGLRAEPSLEELNRRQLPVFYNPMWRFLPPGPWRAPELGGDAEGTFYGGNSPDGVAWSVLDQVLATKDLARRVASVRIMRSLGGNDLFRKFGRPDSDRYSDHFPILVKIQETGDA